MQRVASHDERFDGRMTKKCVQLVSFIMVFALMVGLCSYVPSGKVQATSVDESGNVETGEDTEDGENTETGDNTEEGEGSENGNGTEEGEHPEITSIVLEQDTKTLLLNEQYQVKASVLPEGAQVSLMYESTDNEVVKVDDTGLVTAIGVGETTVVVSAKEDSSVKAVFTVKVMDAPVQLSFDKATHVMKATDTVCLQPQVVYASGKVEAVDTSQVTFVSLHPAVATVDETGKVTALEQTNYPQIATIEGSYTYTYEADGETVKKTFVTQCQITVTMIPVENLVLLNKEDQITLKINETYELDVQILPENATNKGVTYSTSNKNVAKVSSKGVITAKGIGEAVITITSKENPALKKTFDVKVYQTIFNVEELGAKGTDTKTDDTVINKALKYASYKLLKGKTITVVVPKGIYYIEKTLNIYSNTNLILEDGAIIKRKKTAGGKAMLRNYINEKIGGYGQCENITVNGGVWDGNSDGSDYSSNICIGHGKNVTISNTVVKDNSGAHLIELVGVDNALIENVELYGYKKCKKKGYVADQSVKEAIQIEYCSSHTAKAIKPYDYTASKNIIIRNCNIHDYMCGIGSHGSVAGVYLENVYIMNNKFEDITNACIDLRNFKNVKVSGNKATKFTTFLYASASDGTITNNTINNKSFKKMTNSGLISQNGITVSNKSSFTITKNTITKNNSNGITVWNASKAVIKNNKIKNNQLYGIRTQGSNITLKSNKFSGNKSGVYDTYKDAKVVSSDDIRAYYVNVKKSYKYNGKPVKPKIKLKNLKKKYYKVTYKNNKRPGTATVIIKGKGKVKQTLKIKYKIKR